MIRRMLMLCGLAAVLWTAGCAKTADKDALADEPAVLDLTLLNDMLAYAKVSAITASPYEYIGQAVKLNGVYDHWQSPADAVLRHYIILSQDECCAQGFELDLNGLDPPPVMSGIQLSGVFRGFVDETSIRLVILAREITPLD